MESSAASASTPAEDAEEKIPVDLLGLADEMSMWNPRSSRHYDVLKFIAKDSHSRSQFQMVLSNVLCERTK